MNTGDRIKQRRIELGLTADELAKKIGKSRATIYKYENGDIENMPTPVLEPLARALETTPADLMGWTAEDVADAMADLADTALKTAMTLNEVQRIRENSYENLVITEMKKMNQKGKVKLLDTAREMVCNPLYNPDYEIEVNAAQARTDIDVPEGTDTSDNDIMDDENF